MTTLTIIRNDEPLTVWLEWLTQDHVVYGLIAYRPSGEAVVLTDAEELEGLEVAYAMEPAPSY